MKSNNLSRVDRIVRGTNVVLGIALATVLALIGVFYAAQDYVARRSEMGEVRSTIESKAPTSPLPIARELKEKILDLRQVKVQDLESEGKPMETRNRKSIETLDKAIAGTDQAIKALEMY